jgi:hypothetical protein
MSSKKSTDLYFNAFLLLKGYKIERYDVNDKHKVTCYYKISDEEWQKLRLEFASSEFSNIKMAIEKIKDLAF